MMIKKMEKKKAQSTLEYVLMLTAVLLAIIGAISSETGPIRSGLTNFFNQLGQMIGGIVRG